MGLVIIVIRAQDPTPASSVHVAWGDREEPGDDGNNWTYLVPPGINEYIDVGSNAAEVVQHGAENAMEDWLDTPSPSVPTTSSVQPKTVPEDPPSPSVPTASSVQPKEFYCPLCDQLLGGPAQWEDHRIGKRHCKKVLATTEGHEERNPKVEGSLCTDST